MPAQKGNGTARREVREQASLEGEGADLAAAQMRAVEAFLASARAVSSAIGALERAVEALGQAEVICQRGAARADRAHKQAVALAGHVSRLDGRPDLRVIHGGLCECTACRPKAA